MAEDKSIFEILDEEPQDHAAGQRKEAKINPDDFAEVVEETPNDERDDTNNNKDPASGNATTGTNGDTTSESDGTKSKAEEDQESEEEEKPELTERQEKIQEAKKEVVQSLLEPATIIAFTDMGLSRLGSMVPNSQRSDWQLDPEEKEIFALILDATIEEEGIQFWPAKTWLFIAVIFVYGTKGFLVWDGSADSQAQDPELLKLEGDKEIARLEIIRDIEKQKAALKTEISEYQEITIEPSGSNGAAPKIPDDGYVYNEDGSHVKNVDGSYKKKPGTKPAGREVVEEAEVIEDKPDGEE